MIWYDLRAPAPALECWSEKCNSESFTDYVQQESTNILFTKIHAIKPDAHNRTKQPAFPRDPAYLQNGNQILYHKSNLDAHFSSGHSLLPRTYTGSHTMLYKAAWNCTGTSTITFSEANLFSASYLYPAQDCWRHRRSVPLQKDPVLLWVPFLPLLACLLCCCYHLERRYGRVTRDVNHEIGNLGVQHHIYQLARSQLKPAILPRPSFHSMDWRIRQFRSIADIKADHVG